LRKKGSITRLRISMADHAEMAGSENGNDASGVFGTWRGAQPGFFARP
jgi:hypothetical protein